MAALASSAARLAAGAGSGAGVAVGNGVAVGGGVAVGTAVAVGGGVAVGKGVAVGAGAVGAHAAKSRQSGAAIPMVRSGGKGNRMQGIVLRQGAAHQWRQTRMAADSYGQARGAALY